MSRGGFPSKVDDRSSEVADGLDEPNPTHRLRREDVQVDIPHDEGAKESASPLLSRLTARAGIMAGSRSLYLGTSLLFFGILSVVAGIGIFGFSMRLGPDASRYLVTRGAAVGLIAGGAPLFLSGVTLHYSGSRRVSVVTGLGLVSSLVAAANFTMLYPGELHLESRSFLVGIAGLYVVGILTIVLTTGLALGSQQESGGSSDDSDSDSAGVNDGTNVAADSGNREVNDPDHANDVGGDALTAEPPDLSDLHTSLVAAPGIALTSNSAQVGEQWVKSLVVVNYPDAAVTRMLDRPLTRLPDIDLDYSIHIKPRDPTRTVGKLKKSIRDLKVKRAKKADRGDVTQIDTEQTLDDHEAIYSQLVSGSQHVFDVSLYLTVRGDEEAEVEQAAERLTRSLQSSQLTAKSVSCRQLDGLVSTSPVGTDVLGHSGTMLGGAVGCLYPFSSGTVIEETGVLIGYHSVTGSPVVVDRFAREKGYNCLIAGNIGAGKTFNSILNLLRTFAKDDDTMVIVADPFGDLGVLTDILGGERVVMSGKRGLNPLEISPTPEAVLEANPDLDPYTKTVQKDVMEFIQAFFTMEGMSLAEKRGALSVAIKEAYRRQGITPEPDTHGKESPTLRDVQDVLTDIAQNPTEYIGSEEEPVPQYEADLWREHTSQLRMDLAPFREGGEYANLGRQTEIDIVGRDVLYLDMQQIEGKQKTGLMLQLVLRAIYERAKQTDKKVIFAIDEAHYLMQNSASLSFLERATRHARHYDLSLQLITQTVDEFFSRADTDELAQKTKAIADNCVLKIFHQVEGLTDGNAEEWLDLSPPEAEFIRNAKPGSEEYGYSQALVEVGEAGRFPVNVHALPEEETLIVGNNPGWRTSFRKPNSRRSSGSEVFDNRSDRSGSKSNSNRDTGVPHEDSSHTREDSHGVSGGKLRSHQQSVGPEEVDIAEVATLLNRVDPLELREYLGQVGTNELENIADNGDDE